jgi:hypothetical protein
VIISTRPPHSTHQAQVKIQKLRRFNLRVEMLPPLTPIQRQNAQSKDKNPRLFPSVAAVMPVHWDVRVLLLTLVANGLI